MLLFAKDKKTLHQYLQQLETFIHEQLALKLKPSATLIAPVSEGIPFLGFRIFPNLIRLNRQSLRRFRRRKISYERAYQCGKLDVEKLTASVQSMIAHIQHANSRRLQQSLLLPSLPLG